jgi:gag-polypeptide of LTR copia-type
MSGMSANERNKEIRSDMQMMPKLNGKNWKHWNDMLIEILTTYGMEGVIDDKSSYTQEEKDSCQCIKMAMKLSIDDAIINQYLAVKTPHELYGELKKCFYGQTESMEVLSYSKFFTISGHVASFDQTLNKLEGMYNEFVQLGQGLDPKQYVAAIIAATLLHYQHVVDIYEQEVCSANVTKVPTAPTKIMEPLELMAHLCMAFTKYQLMKVTQGCTGQGSIFPHHDECYHPYFNSRYALSSVAGTEEGHSRSGKQKTHKAGKAPNHSGKGQKNTKDRRC